MYTIHRWTALHVACRWPSPRDGALSPFAGSPRGAVRAAWWCLRCVRGCVFHHTTLAMRGGGEAGGEEEVVVATLEGLALGAQGMHTMIWEYGEISRLGAPLASEPQGTATVPRVTFRAVAAVLGANPVAHCSASAMGWVLRHGSGPAQGALDPHACMSAYQHGAKGLEIDSTCNAGESIGDASL